MRSAPTIEFEVRPARSVATGLVALTVLAVTAVVASGLGIAWTASLAVLAVLGGSWATWRYLHPVVRHVRWPTDGACELELADGNNVDARLVQGRALGDSVFLSFAPGRLRRHSVWLLGGNSSARTRRQLRMRIHANTASG